MKALNVVLYLLLLAFFLNILACCLSIKYGLQADVDEENVAYGVAVSCLILIIVIYGFLSFYHPAPAPSTRSSPLFVLPKNSIPVIPALAIIVNSILLLNFQAIVWIRFVIWMVFGMKH